MQRYNSGLFDIVTLSDRASVRNFPKLKTHYLRHGNELIKRRRLGDPITIITGATALINQLFPNWLGSSARSTMQDFISLLPGNGQWTTRFREYLLANIKYQKDISRDMRLYTERFVKMNHSSLYPQTHIDNWGVGEQKFVQILRQEAAGQGTQVYPGIDTGGLAAYLPYLLIGGVVLLALNKKKK